MTAKVKKAGLKQARTLNEAAEIYFRDTTEENLHELVVSGSRLIYYFVRLYGVGICREELYQVGVEGLMKAVRRFDPEYGSTFATYAGNCITGEIRHFVRKETSYYKPAAVEATQSKIGSLTDKTINEGKDTPSHSEFSEAINVNEEESREAMRVGLVPLDDIDMSSIVYRHHESSELPIEDKILLENALEKLSDLQKKVIQMLFLSDMTQMQVSHILGVDQRKVSRIKQKGIKALQLYINNN